MTGLADDSDTPAADGAIERAAQAVADGEAVDWAALGERVPGDEGREQLECLRIIGAIANLHQATVTMPADKFATPVDGSNPPKSAGEPWGRYRLLDLVGSGQFGDVYRAWDPQLEFEIAIKILHRRVANDQLKAKLLDEGRALAKVRHANVVRVYGVESDGDRVGLCMEFVRGETLASAIGRGHRLSAREAIHVGQDVCRALAAVHHAGFVHRDVTAKNIMRDQAGNIVLMDFGTGLQTTQDAAGGRMTIAGTPMYMAPETLAGQPASPGSDVYSVGVLLYHLVTGKFPVEGRTIEELRTAHMLGRRTPLAERAPDLPIPFIRAVEHALAANPQQRCPSAAALLQELATAGTERRTRTEYIVWSAAALAGVALVLTALGALISEYFNLSLGRSDFANESAIDWFRWGVTASVSPIFMFAFALLALGILLVTSRLLLNMSATARNLKATLLNAARRYRLDDVSTLSSCALLVSVVALGAVWWYFLPFFGSLPSGSFPDNTISTAPAASLAFLSPHFRPHHLLYRKVFIAAIIFCVAIWNPAIWLAARKGEPIKRSILAGGVAVLLLLLLSLDFPYRLLTGHYRDFEAVRWSGESCYILGERPADLLLFCPETSPPRNRIVQKDDPNLERTRVHVQQDIFTNVAKDK